MTEPGAAEQAHHADGPPVTRDEWRQHAGAAAATWLNLPAHALTVFVPLVDLSAANGATRFYPGSHLVQTHAALRAEADEAGSSAGAGAPVALAGLGAGDAIVFDYRLFHAGTCLA